MSTRLSTILPGLALLTVLSMFLPSCTRPESPQIQGISQFGLKRDNPERGPQLGVSVEVFNPNKFRIKLKRYDLTVFLNGVEVGHVRSWEKKVMDGELVTAIRLSLDTDLRRALGGVASLAGGLFTGKEGMDLRITGKVRAKARGIGKSVPVDLSKTVKWSEMGL